MTSALAAILPFILFAITVSVTPGPNNTMLAASGATFGFRRSIPHLAGIAIGFGLMVLLVTLGVGQALRAAPAPACALSIGPWPDCWSCPLCRPWPNNAAAWRA